MTKNAPALKKLAVSVLLATLALAGAAAHAASVLSEPHRAFCRAPGMNWSLVLDFDKFDTSSADGQSELSFLSSQPNEGTAPQLNREASYQVIVHKVAQFPEVDFDSYRVVFGEESSNFILNLPRDRKGKSILARAYLSTDGQTQNLACAVNLREADALATVNARDLEREQSEAKIAEHDLPAQVCAVDYLDEKSKTYEFGCSATVVSSRDLLTAGHCQQIYQGRPAQARCPGQPSIAIDLSQSVHHEKHVEDMWKVSYDIALLRLSAPITTPPAELAADSQAVAHAIFDHPENCALYGYGRELDGHIGRLHGVKFEFPPDDLGGRSFSETNFADEHMISTDPRLFLRGGDSGGPILCAGADGGVPLIVGVHSILFALDSSANSSSVGFNADWINDHLYTDETDASAPQAPPTVVRTAADGTETPKSDAEPIIESTDN